VIRDRLNLLSEFESVRPGERFDIKPHLCSPWAPRAAVKPLADSARINFQLDREW
jgi:hypothetical protein